MIFDTYLNLIKDSSLAAVVTSSVYSRQCMKFLAYIAGRYRKNKMVLDDQQKVGDWEFQKPKKRPRTTRYKEVGTDPLSTSNSFEKLNEESENDTDMEIGSDEETEQSKPQNRDKKAAATKKDKIPPIVVYSYLKEHMATMKQFKSQLSGEISVKMRGSRMIIYTENVSDYQKVLQKVKESKIDFHTYTLENKKQVTSILKGLPTNISPEEIKEELAEFNLNVIDVKQFIKKIRNPQGNEEEYKLPIFSVKFGENTKVGDFKNIRKLCYCKVSWEKNVSPKLVTQCYKCQGFGHIAINCYRSEVCTYCSKNHNFKNCTASKKEYKCINCGGNHASNDQSCERFISFATKKNNANLDELHFSQSNTLRNRKNASSNEMRTPVPQPRRHIKVSSAPSARSNSMTRNYNEV